MSKYLMGVAAAALMTLLPQVAMNDVAMADDAMAVPGKDIGMVLLPSIPPFLASTFI